MPARVGPSRPTPEYDALPPQPQVCGVEVGGREGVGAVVDDLDQVIQRWHDVRLVDTELALGLDRRPQPRH